VSQLPPEAAQAYLLRELTSLIVAHGWQPFVSTPLLEPCVDHFPDAWRPDAIGVERLARRLLVYAGLPDLEVDVELFESDLAAEKRAADRPASGGWSHRGTAAWFAGIEDGRCLFGASTAKLAVPDVLAGVMAHEVAHAFRHHHALALSKREVEEPLTDLTTIYLGFGVLTTNASYRYRASGELRAGATRTEWSHQSVGYLPPESMSFLLACQAVARGLPAGEVRRIAGLLEANQAGSFKAACKMLERSELLARLKLPLPADWPAVPAARPVPFDTTHDPPPPDPALHQVVASGAQHQGLAVFRVGQTAAGVFTAVGLALGIPIALLIAVAGSGWGAVFALGGTMLVGRALGKQRGHDRCSEPECNTVIPDDVSLCPGCGGTVSGRIAHVNDRLAAREELEEAQGEGSAPMT
jgi:hypothetical protein